MSRKPSSSGFMTRFGLKKNSKGAGERLIDGNGMETGMSQVLVDKKPDLEPVLSNEDFINKFGYSYDYVLVFPVNVKKDVMMHPKEIVEKLHKYGLQTYLYLSVQKDEIICKIRAPLQKLRNFADRSNYNMLLDEQYLKRQCEAGHPPVIQGFDIKHEPSVSDIRPHQYIYARYDEDARIEHLYAVKAPLKHSFSNLHRVKLIYEIMQAPHHVGGCDLHLNRLLQSNSILAYYPIHNDAKRDELVEKWIVKYQWPWHQPLDLVKDYLGEKVAMYFAFLGHYTTWLLYLGLPGLAVMLDIVVEWNMSALLSPFFAIFVSLWSVLMMEYWKRKECTLSMMWGMRNFEEKEHDRPDFFGEKMPSYITGKPMKFFPPSQLNQRLRSSITIIAMMILLVLICVGAIYGFRYYLMYLSGVYLLEETGSTIASVLNSIQILILNAFYSKVAVWLNDRENHRTDTEYEDVLIAKLFLFQFINSYASLFYIAYIRPFVTLTCSVECMGDLLESLAIIFIVRLLTGNVTEIMIPRYMAKQKAKKEMEGVEEGVELTPAEKDYSRETYDVLMGPIDDFSNLAVQFGYVTLFVVAFPLAPILAYVNNYIEIRADAWKLLKETRRPIPRGAEDIGTWQSIFELTAYAAVITNAALVMFTMDLLSEYTWRTRVWLFVLYQYFVFGAMFLFQYMLDDVSSEVIIQDKRTEFIVSKMIDREPDEDDDDDLNTIPVDLNVAMHVKDQDDYIPFINAV